MGRKSIYNIESEIFKKYVLESVTWSELARKCGYNNTTNNKTLKKRCSEENIDVSHLPVGLNWMETHNYLFPNKLKGKKKPLEEILVENNPQNGGRLRRRLINELGWEEKCLLCGLDGWMGKPITLELDHINGNHSDNRIENLRQLCPNCHSQTKTFRVKNCKTYVKVNKDSSVSIVDTPKEKTKCIDCFKEIRKESTRCKYCQGKKDYNENIEKSNRPTLKQIEKDLETMSMVAVGKKYGVSDNAVRKWIKKYKKYSQV